MALSNIHFIYIVFIVMFLNLASHPVLCDDSVWSAWSRCKTPCPWKWCRNTLCIGARTRSKTCTNSEKDTEGRNCTGAYKENVFCLLNDCRVKGEWSDWTSWSACSVTCGTGYRQRIRFCSDQETVCRGSNFEKVFCDAELVCSDEGFFSPWSEWGLCSQPCGGIRERQRTCAEPLLSGKHCSGNLEEIGKCSANNCKGKLYYRYMYIYIITH
ncbi:semaphorin-5B-like [Ostrea edulis]|uniref:semaphorin-5B-like n=1 Tax=Ostrea edulis TaxID=37623 RepID=UPI0024AEE43B|nr:semaphorin-5B-like [Ostrea edulis]